MPETTTCPEIDIFDAYERRFAQVMANIPKHRPWLDADRAAIADSARACLGICEDWVPEVNAETAGSADAAGLHIEFLTATSWPGTAASAFLYLPTEVAPPWPGVVLCCGHGENGKHCPGYQEMARHIARHGAAVLCLDNIGQGERQPMGHRDVPGVFAAGTSLQGLIVTETLGWLRWLAARSDIDARRLAAVGNSGGGTLTTFLAALAPELAALSSSGYPSTFEFVARKEKRHCDCNILPHIVGELEMWHLLGSFAPKPLLIFQGNGDSLFPVDYFYTVARQIRSVYRQLNADDAFRAKAVAGQHSWDANRRALLGEFLANVFDLPLTPDIGISEDLLSPETDRCFPDWPADALSATDLAIALTGTDSAAGVSTLEDVFPPPAGVRQDIALRADTSRILAQFEAFLAASAKQPSGKPE